MQSQPQHRAMFLRSDGSQPHWRFNGWVRRLLILTLLAISLPAATRAQDAAAMASQQAMQQAQMANQQAMQQAQMDSQQALQNAQMANQQALQNGQLGVSGTASPRFSLASGTYPASTLVRLKSRSRSAQIFYTTDGWTPTPQSTPYTGPIPLTSSMTIQAIAIAPGSLPSSIAKAEYIVPDPAPTSAPMPRQISSNEIELPQNTKIPLVFAAKLDSQTAQIGDIVPLELASDLIINGAVVAAKGTPAQARVSAVDRAGFASAPGIITFTLVSIRINGVDVTLAGTKTRQGATHEGRKFFMLVPWVGTASLLAKGDPAEIAPQTPVTALVATKTDIPFPAGPLPR